MMVMQPLEVAFTTSSMRALVPRAKASHSNTPTGPFHTICLALATASAYFLLLSGPQSKPYRVELKERMSHQEKLLREGNTTSTKTRIKAEHQHQSFF